MRNSPASNGWTSPLPHIQIYTQLHTCTVYSIIMCYITGICLYTVCTYAGPAVPAGGGVIEQCIAHTHTHTHTHTRAQAQRYQLEVSTLPEAQRELYRSERLGVWTKLRPGAREFLSHAADKFELWVYSASTRCVERLAPHGSLAWYSVQSAAVLRGWESG